MLFDFVINAFMLVSLNIEKSGSPMWTGFLILLFFILKSEVKFYDELYEIRFSFAGFQY